MSTKQAPQATPYAWALVVQDEAGNVEKFDLMPGRKFRVGRSSENDVVIRSARVSRHVFLLEINNEMVQLTVDERCSHKIVVGKEILTGGMKIGLTDGRRIVMPGATLRLEKTKSQTEAVSLSEREYFGISGVTTQGPGSHGVSEPVSEKGRESPSNLPTVGPGQSLSARHRDFPTRETGEVERGRPPEMDETRLTNAGNIDHREGTVFIPEEEIRKSLRRKVIDIPRLLIGLMGAALMLLLLWPGNHKTAQGGRRQIDGLFFMTEAPSDWTVKTMPGGAVLAAPSGLGGVIALRYQAPEVRWWLPRAEILSRMIVQSPVSSHVPALLNTIWRPVMDMSELRGEGPQADSQAITAIRLLESEPYVYPFTAFQSDGSTRIGQARLYFSDDIAVLIAAWWVPGSNRMPILTVYDGVYVRNIPDDGVLRIPLGDIVQPHLVQHTMMEALRLRRDAAVAPGNLWRSFLLLHSIYMGAAANESYLGGLDRHELWNQLMETSAQLQRLYMEHKAAVARFRLANDKEGARRHLSVLREEFPYRADWRRKWVEKQWSEISSPAETRAIW